MSLEPLQPITGTKLYPISSSPSLLGQQHVTTDHNEAVSVARRAWMLYKGPTNGSIPSTEPKADRGLEANGTEIDKYFHPRLIFNFGHAAILLDEAAKPTGLRFQGPNFLNPLAGKFEIWDANLRGGVVNKSEAKLPPRPGQG